MQTRKQYVLAVILGMSIGIALYAMSYAQTSDAKQDSSPQKEPVRLPQVISKVKDLEVKSVVISREGEPQAVVAIEIYNNSDRAIVSLAMETGDEENASGISTDGFRNASGTPSIILQPHGTITMRMPLRDVRQGKPIRVAAVMYADGTVEGDSAARSTIEGHKRRAEKRRRNNL